MMLRVGGRRTKPANDDSECGASNQPPTSRVCCCACVRGGIERIEGSDASAPPLLVVRVRACVRSEEEHGLCPAAWEGDPAG